MGVFKVAGSVVKTCADVRTWTGFDYLKDNTVSLTRYGKKLISPRKASFQESFEEAQNRLGLEEKDITKIEQRFLRLSYFYCLLTGSILCYMLYLFWHAALISGCIATLVSLLSAVKAFESNFYYFQIKNRKLGCTLHEWLKGKVNEEMA